MNTIDAPQGSQEWLQIRAKHFTASEAPAMLGLSKYKTRQELLREKATGLTEEVDANKQRLFDAGHEAEAIARPLAEAYLQEDLFPVTGSAEIDGLPLLASFDGLNMEETLAWENKLASESVEAMIARGDLDGTYWPQCEQQMLVSGAQRVLFTACDGEQITAQLWYESKPERRAQLIAGWKQFAEDLANYQHVEAAPIAVAAPINELPALMVEISGSVTASNLEQWRDIVTARIASINTDLKTDQDFADADSMVKFLDDGEKRIDLVKSQAQANAADIDRVFRALDEIKASMRAKRLDLNKRVTERKDSIKIEILKEGALALADHVVALNKRIGKPYMPNGAADGNFGAVMKGKRTVASLRDAVATELARCKIVANEIADRIQINMAALAQMAADYPMLMKHEPQLVLKAPDDMTAQVKAWIADHKEAEEKRIAAEREKIRAEEEAKAERREQERQAELARAALLVRQQSEADEAQRKAAEEAAAKIERDRLRATQATPAPVLAEKSVADANARAFVDSISTTEPAAPAAPGASSPRLDETPTAAAPTHKGITGSARLLDRLDDLARQMTERELSELCIHAAHILEQRRAAA